MLSNYANTISTKHDFLKALYYVNAEKETIIAVFTDKIQN